MTTEALRLGKPARLPHLINLFNAILRTGHLPRNLCHSTIILVSKKDDGSDIGNYRPITLMKIIERRIAGKLDEHQPVEQAGFRPDFSITDHVHTVNQVIEKANEYNKTL